MREGEGKRRTEVKTVMRLIAALIAVIQSLHYRSWIAPPTLMVRTTSLKGSLVVKV